MKIKYRIPKSEDICEYNVQAKQDTKSEKKRSDNSNILKTLRSFQHPLKRLDNSIIHPKKKTNLLHIGLTL